ncbi:class I SAM-dependent methyltransferase [Plesiomonas shigelloides]|uniref:class I SAM-dependent methyltransferase n=1 Tax=Plesiomonas shigelloides TaxID=703 RepID=UPI003261B71B
MSEQYDNEVSLHYAAYRPPLHQQILAAALAEDYADHKVACGVDIGCGTGLSTQALKPYCVQAFGIDPSAAMLEQASESTGITYLQGTGEDIALPDGSVDIVTFAGSLSYAKSSALVQELVRVCRPNATIVVYDFEVLLRDVMVSLGILETPVPSNYDHAINFHGCAQLNETKVRQEQLTLVMTSEQLAHVLFSSSRRYQQLIARFGAHNTFTTVVQALNHKGDTHPVKVDIYYSTYQPSV